jgi:hypothetical protein
MKTIPLTQGKVALVDDSDYEELSKYNWQFGAYGYVTRYANVNGKGTTVRMHRQIMGSKLNMLVDHKNGNRLDNQRHNLRSASDTQNKRNIGITANNTSGFKGVSLDRKRGTFRAMIQSDSGPVFLGRYATAPEAAKAYDIAAKKFHHEFAKVNGVDISTPPKKAEPKSKRGWHGNSTAHRKAARRVGHLRRK